MKQRTITNTRAVTVMVEDDNQATDQELIEIIDKAEDSMELIERHGITVLEDETLNWSGCVTEVPDEEYRRLLGH
jgi:hypothetical protein